MLKKIKKGDIVGRISYGKDILFIVDRLIKTNNNEEIAILKGIIVRIKADSPVNDLEKIDKRVVEIKVNGVVIISFPFGKSIDCIANSKAVCPFTIKET